jgi:anaerobic magnesium-protoporphyrin IX monomethyl ester cyclase
MIPAKSVLLLSCRSPFLDDSKVYCPLANLYLKSYLNAYLPEVEVVIGDDEYDVDDLSAMEPYDAIGISVMTPQRHEAKTLANAIKRRWPNKTLIAGGPHVKHYCYEMEQDRSFDYLVPLDGERALARILAGRATERVVTDTLTRDEVLSQPRPDRISATAINSIRRYHYYLGEREATTLITARGCPERCTFCEDALTNVRWSSLESIKMQLLDIKRLGYRGVYIFDDLFAISMNKIRPICEELHGLDLMYRCNAQARYFTKWGENMAQLLSDTGCYEIAFGAESGSQQILDNIQKRCTVRQNYQTVEYAKKHGIIVKAFILIGLPGETWKTLAETENFIKNSGCDDFQCAVYMPFKGTQIRAAIDNGNTIDLKIVPKGPDGEVTGAYGIKEGNSSYEVRTSELSCDDLQAFREYLVMRYRPESHRMKWRYQDRFFDIAHITTSSGSSGQAHSGYHPSAYQ